jgi:hypothetical protein
MHFYHYKIFLILSPHPWSEWAQEVPSKGAGISNVECRLHEFRSDGCRHLEKKERGQQCNTSIFNIPCSTLDIRIFINLVTEYANPSCRTPDRVRGRL